MAAGQEFSRLVEIMHRLRSECPWDRRQDHESLRPYLLEETYEVLHALDEGSCEALKEELGDLLLQVVFHAEIACEEERFGMEDVIRGISEKLVRRHPHVFGDVDAPTPGEVIRNWENIKSQEKAARSVVDGIPGELPALLRLGRLLGKMRQVGVEPLPEREAVIEAECSLRDLKEGAGDAKRSAERLLVWSTRLAMEARPSPEDVLREFTKRMEAAFRLEEAKLAAAGEDFEGMTREQLLALSERVLAASFGEEG
jgi:tetrapyrrole methylase family protein/MazG family protein